MAKIIINSTPKQNKIAKQLNSAQYIGYSRVYSRAGEMSENARGTAIRVMLSFIQEGKSVMGCYRKYKKSYGTRRLAVVSYIRYLQLVTPFIGIINTQEADQILTMMDNNPKITYQSALALASQLSSLKALTRNMMAQMVA